MTTAWDKTRAPMPAKTGCVGKARYRSRDIAMSAMRTLREVYPGSYDSTVRPFRCPVCRKWHLGHGW